MKLKDHAFAIKENEDSEKCDTCGRIKFTECTCNRRSHSAKLSEW